MTRATRRLAAVALLAALALFVASAAPTANAQPRNNAKPAEAPPAVIPGSGTELFRAFLDREGIQPVRANNLWITEDTIVIVIGSTNGRDWLDPFKLAREAIQRGGAALIASDNWAALYESNTDPNVGWPVPQPVTQVHGAEVNAAPRDCYQPNQWEQRTDTPFVVPVSPDERLRAGTKPGRVWSVFRGLSHLATNKPSYLLEPREYRAEFQHPLARLPKSSMIKINAWQQQQFASPPLFAVGGDGTDWNGRPSYSFLAVADSSVYINLMVMEQGTDNLEFTLRTIEYLQGPDKKRKRCLFFEDGQVIEKFDGLRSALAKPAPKIPPEAVPNIGPLIGKNQDVLVEKLDDLSDRLQKADALHKTAVGPPGSERERRGFWWYIDRAVILLAVLGCAFLLRRSLAARQPMDVPPPPNTGAGAASTGPPGVFDRRQRELVRRNNLYEPVKNLMREFFDSVGAPANPSPKPPRIVVDRSVRKPDSLRQAIRDMWRIAYGPPAHISAQRWFELEPYFNRLRRAHEDGKWRFETGDEA